jgi:hypothetical protein
METIDHDTALVLHSDILMNVDVQKVTFAANSIAEQVQVTILIEFHFGVQFAA